MIIVILTNLCFFYYFFLFDIILFFIYLLIFKNFVNMNMTSKIVKIMKWPQIDQIPSKIHVLEFIFIFFKYIRK